MYLNAFSSVLSPQFITFNYILIGISAILFAIKKLMSIIQLISASEQIAEWDMESRTKIQWFKIALY